MSNERPVEPFSDLHVEEGKVRATLLHDPTVEGLEVGLYLDGSGSMREEYAYSSDQPRRTFWEWLLRKPAPPPRAPGPNQVEPQARWMLQYLASKDRNGQLRVAYWACAASGRDVEVIGELDGREVERYAFPGPRAQGGFTYLAPAIRDYVEYLRGQAARGAKRGLGVFVTDGQLHDAEEVAALTREVAAAIAANQLPRVHFVLAGVGDGVDEEQLERIAHIETEPVGHLWCHRTAKEIQNVAELVAGLVDETMTVAAGGTIYDDRGKVLRAYEGRLPAVLEFAVPEGCKSFTLEVSGQRYTQPLPEDDDHDEEHR